ncbi:menaquinol oxidoreductase [Desulfoluna limicola]|uniref:Menaquinol oxidoreductase n=1 Tax=Desulfoluna limicola TaxID=2810562 RepID=A0ABN6F8E5_9BACT|nr:NrfD/PsrC family molybdoenzyme membrane anchor subunit [Desulfoluna limicola]BCS98343.1 menaquinol oxidoreductase [Desulfoluna limicola]
MLEKALTGSRNYWLWLAGLAAVIAVAFMGYLQQWEFGLGITGMSRDVSWGFYIAQFTFLVGVAAGGVMLVLPYYLHDYKAFGRITILGEFLAVSAVVMCMLFIVADLGQPMRAMNVVLNATPHSMLMWDAIVLNGYLFLNIIIGWKLLEAERNGVPAAKWVKILIYISIPWAFGIHTVTAYLYCGLPGRGFWLTAVLAPRFLASAFAAGPAFLILLCFIVRKVTNFDPGLKAMQTLMKIITYALIANVFFFFCEVFTVFYSGIPEHMDHLKYLFFGHNGHGALVPFMWTSMFLMLSAIGLLLFPKIRNNEKYMPFLCIMVFVGTWIDKGMGMIAGGFVPNPMHDYVEYTPTPLELLITVGVYAVGFLVLTILFKIATKVKEEVNA